MSDKMLCPGCNSYTSTLLAAVRDGRPCPYCGLGASTILEIQAARERYQKSELATKHEQAVVRAGRAEAEVADLKAKLDRIVASVDRVTT